MRYVLGLDGGGTKCDAVLMDEEGTVLGWGRGGSTHGLYVGSDAVQQSVKDAVLGALRDFRPPIARVAGTHLYAGIADWLGQPLGADQFISAGEQALGFATALTTHGVLVLSGTGSFVYGETADGRHLHIGGNGPIVADEGSAHHIAVLGIRAAFRSHCTAARRTSLAQAIPRAMGVADLHEVFHLLYVERIGRSQIAAVAKTVNAEAEAGDTVATAVLHRAADELGEILVDVIRELRLEDSDEYIVATGSVAQGSRIFWNRLCEIAREVAPRLRPVQPQVRPVMGACLLGLRSLGVPWNQDLMERILATQRSFLDRVTDGAA